MVFLLLPPLIKQHFDEVTDATPPPPRAPHQSLPRPSLRALLGAGELGIGWGVEGWGVGWGQLVVDNCGIPCSAVTCPGHTRVSPDMDLDQWRGKHVTSVQETLPRETLLCDHPEGDIIMCLDKISTSADHTADLYIYGGHARIDLR